MTNKLYSYTTMTELISSMVTSPGWLQVKQGLTLKQEIEERLAQQDNASSTADIIQLSTLAVEHNSDVKLDDKVRDYLHKTPLFKKYERFNHKNKKHEWSLVKIDDLVDDFELLRQEFLTLQQNGSSVLEFLDTNFLSNKKFLSSLDTRIFEAKRECIDALYGQKSYKDYFLRAGQQQLLDEFMQAWDEGFRYYNLDACVRVGKSILSLHIAKTLNLFPCYIGKNLTSQSSVQKDNSGFGIVPNMLTQSIHGTEDNPNAVSKILDNINKSNTENLPVIFFVDEVDDASHTKKSRDTISEVTKAIKKINKFGAFVTMGGTRSYRGLKVLNDLNPDKVKEMQMAYYEMQKLQPDFSSNRNFVNISVYSDGTGFLSVSDSLKSSTGRKSLAKTLSLLLGENSFGIDVNPEFPHYFVKFSTIGKSNANALVTTLNRMYNTIDNKEFKYFSINGDSTTSREAEVFCKQIINSNNCTCVFVTQGMATTSFSVKEIGTSIVMSDNELTADDIQALHRSCTWAEGKVQANLVYLTTSESIELKFDDVFETEVKTLDKAISVQKYKEILERNCITHYMYNGDPDGLLRVKVTPEMIDLVIDKKQKSMTTVSSIVQLMIDEDLPDFEYHGKHISIKKSHTAKGKSVDVFGIENKEKESTVQQTEMSKATKQKILRELVESIVLIPAEYRMRKLELYSSNIDWGLFGISKETFKELINEFPMLKSRIESIYNLCSDKKYFMENYFNKLCAL